MPWEPLPDDTGIGGLKAGRRRREGTVGHIKVQGHLHFNIVSVTSVSKEGGDMLVVVVEERPMIVKVLWCTAIHNKALYKHIIHSFIVFFQ